MATLTPRGQRGITLIEIVLWCAIVAAAVVAVFMFGKKASVAAAVETEQRQVEDIVKTVDSIFATQPNFAALGTNGAVYLRERAARSGLKFQTNDAGDPILATGLGSGSLTLSSWDAVPPSGPAVPNSGYRLAYQGLAPSECSKLVTATYPVAYQVSVGQDGLNDSSATNLATRGQMTVSPSVIAENCAAEDGNATVFLYFLPARAIAAATTTSPPPAARCNPVHETQNVSCPAGQIGTITQERDGTCTGPGNTLVYTVWTTTNDTCQDPPTPPPTVTPPTTPDDCAVTTYTQVLACPTAGEIGRVVQSRNHDTCAGTYTPWVTTSSSCQPQPPTSTCTPSIDREILACPPGQGGGQIVRERSSECLSPSSFPTWPAWSAAHVISNTCTASCLATDTCCEPIPEERPAPCPAGTYGAGGREVRFLGCANATTQSTTWSAWQPYRDLEPSAGCTACPATNTETNTRWDARTDACPVGESGSITYEAEQVQTRDVSYSCPAGTTALPTPTTTAWTGWADTGARRNTVNSCIPSTCTGPTSETQWVGTVGACPFGETGSYTWEREQIRTRTCTASTWGAWSGWGDTGATRNTVNTCAPTVVDLCGDGSQRVVAWFPVGQDYSYSSTAIHTPNAGYAGPTSTPVRAYTPLWYANDIVATTSAEALRFDVMRLFEGEPQYASSSMYSSSYTKKYAPDGTDNGEFASSASYVESCNQLSDAGNVWYNHYSAYECVYDYGVHDCDYSFTTDVYGRWSVCRQACMSDIAGHLISPYKWAWPDTSDPSIAMANQVVCTGDPTCDNPDNQVGYGSQYNLPSCDISNVGQAIPYRWYRHFFSPDRNVYFATTLTCTSSYNPPASPASCNVPAGTTLTWKNSVQDSCTGTTTAASTVANGDYLVIQDTDPTAPTTNTYIGGNGGYSGIGTTGTGRFKCSDGTLQPLQAAGSTCAVTAVQPCNVTTSMMWHWGPIVPNRCFGYASSPAVVPHGGTSPVISDNASVPGSFGRGTATAVCNNGVFGWPAGPCS